MTLFFVFKYGDRFAVSWKSGNLGYWIDACIKAILSVFIRYWSPEFLSKNTYKEVVMTQTMEPATEKKLTVPESFSPKPKPCVAGEPTTTQASSSPKPKPYVAGPQTSASTSSSPKPKPNVASGSATNHQGGVKRLAPLEAYTPAGRSSGSTPKALPVESGMSSKPVAKKRLTGIF